MTPASPWRGLSPARVCDGIIPFPLTLAGIFPCAEAAEPSGLGPGGRPQGLSEPEPGILLTGATPSRRGSHKLRAAVALLVTPDPDVTN